MSTLEFADVTVRFGLGAAAMTAVDHVSLTVPPGTVVGLVGESGSGKSTLGRTAVGLETVTSGQVLLDGRPAPTRGRRRPIQMVFQDPAGALNPRMSVGASIAEAIPRAAGNAPLSRNCSNASTSSRRSPPGCPAPSPAGSASGSRSPGRSRPGPK